MNVIRPLRDFAQTYTQDGAREGQATAHAPATAARASAETAAPQPPTVADMHEVARRLENFLRSVERALEFRVDAQSGRTVISVLDAASGELIRQIPSEEALRFAQMVDDETVVLADVQA